MEAILGNEIGKHKKEFITKKKKIKLANNKSKTQQKKISFLPI